MKKTMLAMALAAGAIVHGAAQEVDIGEVNGHLFVNNSSLGLYPDIVRDRERIAERQRRLALPEGDANDHATSGVLDIWRLR